MKKIVITSGFFNPVHIGHLNLLRDSKKLGDFLIVIVNNDNQVEIKGSIPFIAERERLLIIENLKPVDEVFLSIDQDGTVAKSLEAVAKKYDGELYFAKGGDRNIDNIPESEKEVCEKYGIKLISGVGGGKVQSSSELINSINKLKN